MTTNYREILRLKSLGLNKLTNVFHALPRGEGILMHSMVNEAI